MIDKLKSWLGWGLEKQRLEVSQLSNSCLKVQSEAKWDPRALHSKGKVLHFPMNLNCSRFMTKQTSSSLCRHSENRWNRMLSK